MAEGMNTTKVMVTEPEFKPNEFVASQRAMAAVGRRLARVLVSAEHVEMLVDAQMKLERAKMELGYALQQTVRKVLESVGR